VGIQDRTWRQAARRQFSRGGGSQRRWDGSHRPRAAAEQVRQKKGREIPDWRATVRGSPRRNISAQPLTAGVGEGWLAFAHVRAEARFEGSFLRLSRTNAAFSYLSPSGIFACHGMQPRRRRAVRSFCGGCSFDDLVGARKQRQRIVSGRNSPNARIWNAGSRHSNLMFAALITLAHLSVESATNCVNSERDVLKTR
jgi:hypothetical protein